MAIIKRITKGSALTHAELDGNFDHLEQLATAGVAGELVRGTPIATNTTLNGAESTGISKYTPIESTTDLEITINKGTHVVGQVHNFRKNGNGKITFKRGTNVRLEGRRNINNEHVLINKGNFASLVWDRLDGDILVGSIFGDIDDGYTGAVTTSYYSTITPEAVQQSVTVLGEGFSPNMVVTVTGDANQTAPFTFVSAGEIKLNLTPTGPVGATHVINVTYDNGDITTNSNAIEVTGNTTTYDLLRYLKFNGDATDATGNSTPTSSGVTYVTGKIGQAARFPQNATVSIPNDPSIVFGIAGTDRPFSISKYVRFSTVATTTVLDKKGEYTIDYNSASARWEWIIRKDITFSDFIANVAAFTPVAGQWYHVIFTYDGSKTAAGLQIYVDGVKLAQVTSSAGAYAGMTNRNENLVISSSVFDGSVDEFALHNNELNEAQALELFNIQNGGGELL